MKFGAVMFVTDYSMPVTELARALEDNGFDSLWVPEHTHIPTSRRTPWLGRQELPEEYKHTLDPFVALAAAAAVTTTLELGTGICLVTERDPIVTAKAVASLDHLSNGRVLFGVSAGWNREELENHGTRFETRWRVLRERIEAMKLIWTNDVAEYHGEFVDFEPLWSWPKPVRKPHPPVVVGGNGPRALQRVVSYGDEWLPIWDRGANVHDRIPELRRLADEAGRGHIPVGIYGAPTDAAEIEQLSDAGVERLVYWLRPALADAVLPRIEQVAKVIEYFR